MDSERRVMKREKRRGKREAMEAADLPRTEEVKGTEVRREGGQKMAWEEPANDDDVSSLRFLIHREGRFNADTI